MLLTRFPYTLGTRVPRLLGVRNYLNNYFSMYTRLTRLPYTPETRISHILGFRNYLNNYFSMYTSLTRSYIHADLASPTYFWLRIIIVYSETSEKVLILARVRGLSSERSEGDTNTSVESSFARVSNDIFLYRGHKSDVLKS